MESADNLPDIWRIPLELGFSVFPVALRQKRPALSSWKAYQTESASPVTVTAWSETPSNIGIATGIISRMIVLDLDCEEAVARAEALGLPSTLTVRTGKGRHVYFKHPGGRVGNRTGIFPGADIRGDGGYVVGAGSIHPSGAVYEWENGPADHQLMPAPSWLLELLAPSTTVKRAVAKVRSARPGERNDQLNKSSFAVARRAQHGNIDEAAARSALSEAALHTGLIHQEIMRTVNSGWAAGCSALAEPSEDAIAQAFTERYRDVFRYDHDAGVWFQWDGTRWKRDVCGLAFNCFRDLVRMLGDGRRVVLKASVAAGAERFARTEPAHAVNSSVWDADLMLLGTPGGTVDLRTGELRDARSDEYITNLTGCTPEAGAPKLWLEFLNEALAGNQDVIRFLQQWAGYCLTGDTREHALIFVHGAAGTGKSVFLNTLAGIMGDYAATATMETFTASRADRHSTELAMLNGPRFVTASETEEGRSWAEARIKQLTGGDSITARYMRQDNFTFRPQFKLTLVGNHAPRLKNPDDAMRRRFNIVGFDVKPAVPDLRLEERLRAESGRILAWAIEGCLQWQRSGLIRPASVTTATAEYFAGEDLIGQWLSERCLLGTGLSQPTSELFESWRRFAEAAGEAPGTVISFGKKLARRGLSSAPSNGTRFCRGISLRPDSGSFHAE